MNILLDYLNAHPILTTLVLSTLAHKGVAANQKVNANDLIQLIADLAIRLLTPFASKKDEPQA